MKKRQVRKSCVALLLTSVFIFSSSGGLSATATEDTETSADYRIYFEEGITYSSKGTADNLKAIGGSLTQAAYQFPANGETITVGFSIDSSDTSPAFTIQDGLSDYLSEYYEENGTFVPLGDVDLYYYEVEDTLPVSRSNTDNPYPGLKNVKNVYRLLETPAPETEPDDGSELPAISSNALANSQTGSYHVFIGSETWRYNQADGSMTRCNRNISSPHGGDGNLRDEWYPTIVTASFLQFSALQGKPQTQITLNYMYQFGLENLQVDDNETLEMEIWFYDYYKSSEEAKTRGHSFMPKTRDIRWATNQPNAYLDTQAFDGYGADVYCIGVSDANALVENKNYFWAIRKGGIVEPDGCVNDGRYVVAAQRGYRHLYGGAFGIFSEEHDRTYKLRLSPEASWYDSVYLYDPKNITVPAHFIFRNGLDPVKYK